MNPAKMVSHIQVLIELFSRSPASPIKLKLGLQISGRLLLRKLIPKLTLTTQAYQVRSKAKKGGGVLGYLLLLFLPFTSLSAKLMLGQNHFVRPSLYIHTF